MIRNIIAIGTLTLAAISSAAGAEQKPAPCLDRPAADRGLTHVKLLDIVRHESPERAEYIIRTCGLRSPLTQEQEADLKEVGAGDPVLKAAREMSAKLTDPQPQPGPPATFGTVRPSGAESTEPPKPAVQLAPKIEVAEDANVIKVDVGLVNILFNVRTKKGGLVPDLPKEEFTVFEDGKEQKIKAFTRESNLPLTIGLLVDVSRSQERLIGIEQAASRQFFTTVLKPKDLAFIISFGQDADLLQDYTNSGKMLSRALDSLKLNAPVQGPQAAPVPGAYSPRGTILYDAVVLAAEEQLKNQVGRKVLVLITDGDDQGSRYTKERAIEAAQRADAIIYSVYYVDRAFYNGYGGITFGGGGGESILHRMSDDTGGRVYTVDRNHSLVEIYNEIERDVRSQYSIAYAPTNSTQDGTFRKLEIRCSNKEFKVQARKGYYATPTE
ncbi:MAG TPA: VWA domain-containing protein [Bryobacteraceae bacterium]|jgi:VWFA-related protein